MTNRRLGLLFLFGSIQIIGLAQQSKLRGVVSIHNSLYETGKRVFVFNAQVSDTLANPLGNNINCGNDLPRRILVVFQFSLVTADFYANMLREQKINTNNLISFLESKYSIE